MSSRFPSPVNLQILNPLSYTAWNDLLSSNQDTSFFHTSNWARVLHESYNYKPLYFTEISNNRLKTLFPFMEVKGILSGKRGVSLPFSDYCEPVLEKEENSREVLDKLIAYGKSAGWKSIEIKSGNNLPEGLPFSTYYYLNTLNCSKNEEQIFSTFRDSTKRNIKKAVREGVSIEISHSPESVKEFTRMNCITRKEHGLPPQPASFFKKIHEHIIEKDLGIVILASHNKKTIAGAIFFHFGKKAIYKYGASDLTYQHLRANNLIMWEAIRWYSKNGYQSFCFGRTAPSNKGLLQFKRGWGTEENCVRYYKYDLRNNSFITDSDRTHNKIFKKMPISLLKIIGSLLYKQMG